MDEKYVKFRTHSMIEYDDSEIRLTPRNAMMEGLLSLLRGVARALWFVLAGFGLLLLFAVFVRPAKLMAVLRIHYEDLRTLKMTEDNEISL